MTFLAAFIGGSELVLLLAVFLILALPALIIRRISKVRDEKLVARVADRVIERLQERPPGDGGN